MTIELKRVGDQVLTVDEDWIEEIVTPLHADGKHSVVLKLKDGECATWVTG